MNAAFMLVERHGCGIHALYRTVGRKNTWDDYRGCLRVDVKRSRVLYGKIEGWVAAVTRAAAAPD